MIEKFITLFETNPGIAILLSLAICISVIGIIEIIFGGDCRS